MTVPKVSAMMRINCSNQSDSQQPSLFILKYLFMLSPKANLEMNKEGLAADLVCMLDERSLPRNKARLQELIERFFIAGAARIDLIAKVIDLDNDIGGYNFDIANLKETAKEIESISKARGKSECSVNPYFTFFFTTIHAVFGRFC